MRILELLWIFVVAFSDPVWIPPFIVLGIGLIAGIILAIVLTRRTEGLLLDAEAERMDLLRRRDTVIEAVRALDLEKDKLSAEDYEREKRALLHHGAKALRALEEPVDKEERQALIASVEAQRESLGEARVEAITALLQGGQPVMTQAPESRTTPAWIGGLAVLGGVVALVVLFLGVTAYQASKSHEAMEEAGGPRASGMGGGAPTAPNRPSAPTMGAQEKTWLANLEQNPNDLTALNGLTDWSIRIQDWETAATYNGRALAAEPKDPEARVWKALLEYREGNFPRAVEDLEAVMADNPDYARAYQFRGMIHLQLREVDEAIALFEKALERTDDERGQAGIRQLIGEARQAKAAMAPELAGTVTLADGFDPASLPKTATLFVSVKAANGPPMPLRARKFPIDSFPVSFELTGMDAPMRGGPLPEAITVTVKVDLDGNPMGDDEGAPKTVVEGVKPGTMDLQVVLGG